MKWLFLLAPVEQWVPHKMHLHPRWVQWVEFTNSVKNVPVVLSVLTSAELHTCAWAPYLCFPLHFLFSIPHFLKQGLAHQSCVCDIYILYMSQVQHVAHPSASPSAFQMIAQQDEPAGFSWGGGTLECKPVSQWRWVTQVCTVTAEVAFPTAATSFALPLGFLLPTQNQFAFSKPFVSPYFSTVLDSLKFYSVFANYTCMRC